MALLGASCVALQELVARGLPSHGAKKDLVERLQSIRAAELRSADELLSPRCALSALGCRHPHWLPVPVNHLMSSMSLGWIGA